jgi:hypothetical protein
MPIPKELRHLYRGPEYREFVRVLLDRSGNACEQCGAPNGARVARFSLPEFAAWWWDDLDGIGRDHNGLKWPEYNYWTMKMAYPEAEFRAVKIIIGPAHLNRTPGDLDPRNSRALCQRCHIVLDVPQHVENSRETRCSKKDAKRPVLQEATA